MHISSEGAFEITFDGSFALYGIKAKSGSHIKFIADTDESMFTEDCTLLPAANAQVYFSGTS